MKVLIAEDDLVSSRLLETYLDKWGYDVLVTSDGNEAWEAIQGPEAPSLVISDWMMPNMDGLDLCRKIRQMKRSGYVYFIILTTKVKKEDLIEGLVAGADDFLIKPFNKEELRYRVKIGERIIELERRILNMAYLDPLTGVLNRRAFMERIEGEINRAVRGNAPLSLIFTDIDHFKQINDRYGHQAGDLVLRHFTEQLLGSSRSYDFVGRYGGEEFVVCLPGANDHQVKLVAERMRKGVEEMTIMLPDRSQSIQITASFGVASYELKSDKNVDSLIRRADEAMYRAKREGRNRISGSNLDY
ncbi:MAG: diguanylate cyclase [Desulfobacteraceae bacterium]|nr:diguanylate cyclase [Desulfobacteraceae bacterium]